MLQPIDSLFEWVQQHKAEPCIILVSAAIGQPFESTLEVLRTSAKDAGFDDSLLWHEKDILHDPIVREHFPHLFRAIDDVGRNNFPPRPYCNAFKPLAMLRAMLQSQENDYVMWSDASRHYMSPLNGSNVRRAVNALNRMSERPASAYGLAACPFDCTGSNKCANKERLRTLIGKSSGYDGFSDLVGNPSFWRQPHVVTANILLANTLENRLLVWDWLSMALAKPSDFCFGAFQDETAFSMLVTNRSLPLVNTCPYMNNSVTDKRLYANFYGNTSHWQGAFDCYEASKSSAFFLNAIASHHYDIVSQGPTFSCE